MLCACFVWDNKNFGSMLVLKLKLFSEKLLPVYSFFSDFTFSMDHCNTDDNSVL